MVIKLLTNQSASDSHLVLFLISSAMFFLFSNTKTKTKFYTSKVTISGPVVKSWVRANPVLVSVFLHVCFFQNFRNQNCR